MPEHGEFPYFFPVSEKTIDVAYEVKVSTSGDGPAEDATLSEAKVYKQTSGPNAVSDGNEIDGGDLVKQGEGTYAVSIDGYDPKDYSPLLVRFHFTKDFTTGPKAGTTEESEAYKGVILATPAVAKVKVTPEDVKSTESLTLEVESWAGAVYDSPGNASFRSDPANFPTSEEANVAWRSSMDGGNTWEDLSEKGKKVTFATTDDHAGKALLFEGYLGEPTGKATAEARVVKIEIVGESGSELPSSLPIGVDRPIEVRVTPASTRGELTWKVTGQQSGFVDGQNTPAELKEKKQVKLKGLEVSGAKDDVTLTCKLTSKATDTVYECEPHKLTVDAFEIEEPKPDTVWLTGKELELKGKWKHETVTPEQTSWVVERNPDLAGGDQGWKAVKLKEPGKLILEEEGRYRVAVRPGMPEDEWVTVSGVDAYVVELTYEGLESFQDPVTPPEFKREGAEAKPSVLEPCWYLRDKTVKLKAKLKAKKDLTQDCQFELLAKSGPFTRGQPSLGQGSHRYPELALGGQPTLVKSLAAGVEITVECATPLTACGAYDGTWEWSAKVDGAEEATSLLCNGTRFRLLVTWAKAVFNVDYGGYKSSAAMLTKSHVDAVARWAGMKTSNDGRGLCYALDNNLRHWVIWAEQESHVEDGNIIVSDYPEGTPAPTNYQAVERFNDRRGVSGGRRRVSGILYPMADDDHPTPFDSLVEYSNYQYNYGYKVFDNPDYPGGRCNQQASLICDVIGTHGVEADVLYLQRVGKGKESGRAVRQYFNCYSGGQFWNFHGVVKAKMEDGSWWCYDGSFSGPPNRKNGSQTSFEAAPGPFIHSWSGWSYDDSQARSDRATHGAKADEYLEENKEAQDNLKKVRATMVAWSEEHKTASAERKAEIEAEYPKLQTLEKKLLEKINTSAENWSKATGQPLQSDYPDSYKDHRDTGALGTGEWTGIPG